MSKALLKFVRVSPTKARLIAREVQGMNAELALAALEFMPNKAAGIIAKVIASAVANGEYEPEEVIITSCRIDKAAVMKRWRPRARGTASRIIKPTAHILVEVATAEEVASAKASQPARTKAPKAASSKPAEAAKPAKAKSAEAKPAETKAAAKPEAVKTESKPAAKTQPAADAKPKGDDLTKIKGIGKVYKGKLNDEGIFTFADVATMSDEQIAMMEEKYTFKGDFRESVADAKNFVKEA
jgi:large subunit ribosomal protein L22